MKFTVTERLMGKERPRARVVGSGNNSFATIYTPSNTKKMESIIKNKYIENGGLKDDNALFEVNMVCYKAMPKSFSKRLKIECNNQLCCRKPDNDNILKLVLDALNGVAYKDDTQVVRCSCEKRWTDSEERIEIDINKIIGVVKA